MADNAHDNGDVISLLCPKCGWDLRIPAQYAGQSGTCNRCGAAIVVPDGGLTPEARARIHAQQVDVLPGAAKQGVSPSLRADVGMIATEAGGRGGAWGSLGRMAILLFLFLIIVACVLPALVIGFSAETRPAEQAPRRAVVLPTVGSGAAPAEAPEPGAAVEDGGALAGVGDGGRADEARTVYVTRTGHRYHRAGCAHLESGAMELALGLARSRGLTPCGTCGG